MNHEENQTVATSHQAGHGDGATQSQASQTGSETKQNEPEDANQKIKDLEARLTDLNVKYEALKLNQKGNGTEYKYPPVTDKSKLPDYIKALKTQWGLN